MFKDRPTLASRLPYVLALLSLVVAVIAIVLIMQSFSTANGESNGNTVADSTLTDSQSTNPQNDLTETENEPEVAGSSDTENDEDKSDQKQDGKTTATDTKVTYPAAKGGSPTPTVSYVNVNKYYNDYSRDHYKQLFTKDLHVSGNSYFGGKAYFDVTDTELAYINELVVYGESHHYAPEHYYDEVKIHGTTSIYNSLKVADDLWVQGKTTLDDKVTINGKVTINAQLTTQDLVVTGNAKVNFFNSSLLPKHHFLNLGSKDNRWNNVYAQNGNFSNNVKVSGDLYLGTLNVGEKLDYLVGKTNYLNHAVYDHGNQITALETTVSGHESRITTLENQGVIGGVVLASESPTLLDPVVIEINVGQDHQALTVTAVGKGIQSPTIIAGANSPVVTVEIYGLGLPGTYLTSLQWTAVL